MITFKEDTIVIIKIRNKVSDTCDVSTCSGNGETRIILILIPEPESISFLYLVLHFTFTVILL